MTMSHKSDLIYPVETPPAPGTTLEIAPGVHWVRMPLPFPPDHINLWLLADGDDWAIVDCGLARDEAKAHWESIFAATLGGRKVTRLLVTHFHPDHLGLGQWLTQRWEMPLWMTAAEYAMARMVHGQGNEADIAQRFAFYRGNGVTEDLLAQVGQPNIYRRGVPEIPASFRRMAERQDIRIGAHDWRVVIGRGHAPEHACLWAKDLNVLIGGDILLPRISPNVSVWPLEPFANPLADYLGSLGNFADVPADTLILPAHGLPYRNVPARIAYLKGHHEERLDKLAETARERPLCAIDTFPFLFRREIGANNIGLATGEALAHLHLLEAQGRVRREKDDAGTWRFRAA
jgi:glyoxylase-like metal-dependent hydrolase (beta-lactamase superfamily II)